MPLNFASEDELLEIKKIGGKDETRRHLHNLGFVEGVQLKIVTKSGGNLIVSIKGSRIALSKEMACKIVVGIIH